MVKADPKAHYPSKLADPREREARVKARATEVLQARSQSGSLIEHLPAARDLADVVSLSELSLWRLRAVFRIISHFTDAADAMCCQPRCEVTQGELNDVGKLSSGTPTFGVVWPIGVSRRPATASRPIRMRPRIASRS